MIYQYGLCSYLKIILNWFQFYIYYGLDGLIMVEYGLNMFDGKMMTLIVQKKDLVKEIVGKKDIKI